MIERADKKKNIDKVAASLAKNPLQSEREIAKDTGVSQSAVNRAKEEVGQVGSKDFRIQHLLDKDMELMDMIQEEKFKRLGCNASNVNNSDIDRWEATATKRKAIFGDTGKKDKPSNFIISY